VNLGLTKIEHAEPIKVVRWDLLQGGRIQNESNMTAVTIARVERALLPAASQHPKSSG